MVSLPRLFRKEPEVFDDFDMDIHVMSPPAEPTPSMRYTAAAAFNNQVDPARKAVLSRIALVSIEESASLPALLPDDIIQPTIVQRIMLPRNPRIAGDELYELDAMDMIVVISDKEQYTSAKIPCAGSTC